MSRESEKLLNLYQSLNEENQHALFKFAQFLAAGQEVASVDASLPEAVVPEPKEIPRPSSETVVAAVKRLSASYHMLDKRKLFGETSTLMSAHVMEGRDAHEVIDELEQVFERAYQQLKNT